MAKRLAKALSLFDFNALMICSSLKRFLFILSSPVMFLTSLFYRKN